MGYLRRRQRHIALACLSIVCSISVARSDDEIRRLPDGRYLVQVNDVTVALPEEDPTHKQIGFYVSTPPGTNPFHFYLTDLVRDPDRYASRLRSSEWSSVSAWIPYDHPREIIGVPVVKGVIQVGIHAGPDKNCEAWNLDWARARDEAIAASPDQYGWIRQDHPKSPSWTSFIKFLDERDRKNSRYYAVYCDFFGLCSISACHNNLTARVRINSSNKPRGEDFSVKDFDEQIASGTKVLEYMLLGKSVDLSHP